MKLKKKIPLIDQHDKLGFWGGKFGGSYIPETLKKPVDDLTKEFKKLRKNKKFLKYLSLSRINFLSFLSLLNSTSKSSIGFFNVSGTKFPPNLPPQNPSLLHWSITGIPFLSFIFFQTSLTIY